MVAIIKLLFHAMFRAIVWMAHKAMIPQRRAAPTRMPRRRLSRYAPALLKRIPPAASNPTEGRYRNRYATGLTSGITLETGTSVTRNHATKKTVVFEFIGRRQTLYARSMNRTSPAHAAYPAGGAYKGGRTLTVPGKIKPIKY